MTKKSIITFIISVILITLIIISFYAFNIRSSIFKILSGRSVIGFSPTPDYRKALSTATVASVLYIILSSLTFILSFINTKPKNCPLLWVRNSSLLICILCCLIIIFYGLIFVVCISPEPSSALPPISNPTIV